MPIVLKGDLSRLPPYFPKGKELEVALSEPTKLFPPYCHYWRDYYGSMPILYLNRLRDRFRLNDFNERWRFSVSNVRYKSDGAIDTWSLPDVYERVLSQGLLFLDDCEGIAAAVYAAWHDKVGACLIRIKSGVIHATNYNKNDYEIVDACEPAGMGLIPRGKPFSLICTVP